jgi:hypothetical protein
MLSLYFQMQVLLTSMISLVLFTKEFDEASASIAIFF